MLKARENNCHRTHVAYAGNRKNYCYAYDVRCYARHAHSYAQSLERIPQTGIHHNTIIARSVANLPVDLAFKSFSKRCIASDAF